MKHVYIVNHETSDNKWVKVFKNKKDATSYILDVSNEYTKDGIIMLKESDTMFCNYQNEIYIFLTKEKLN